MPFGFETKEEFDKYIADLTNNQIKGVEQKLKGVKKEIADDLSKQLDSFGQNLGTKFVALEGALSAKRDKKVGKDGKPSDDPDDDAREPKNDRTRTLEKQIEELRADSKKRDEELAREKNKTRTITVRAKLREGLERRGITDAFRIKAASAVLLDQEKRVGFSESFDDAAGFDTDGAPIELDTFLDNWLKTEEGQFYLPPKGTAGTGRSPARPSGTGAGRPGQDNNGASDPGEMLADALRRGEI